MDAHDEKMATVVPDSLVPHTLETSNLIKIESFLNTSEYREIIESSSTYNNRLCAERRMRIPWLDSQTGVAQNHSALLMSRRQRMPPLATGQIYTYPRARWRKKRRQYLMINSRMLSRATDMLDGEADLHSISQMENPALQDTDSKDSQLKEDAKKSEKISEFQKYGKAKEFRELLEKSRKFEENLKNEWYYDEQDMLELDGFDEPDADSDFDYEESYTRRRKNRRSAKGRGVDSPITPRRGKGAGRGRKKTLHNFDPTPGDTDKPFACDLCSARYKTRPGLTYHYTHSHRDPPNSDENSRDSPSLRVHTPCQIPSPQPSLSAGPPLLPLVLPSTTGAAPTVGGGLSQAGQPGPDASSTSSSSSNSVYQDSYVTFLNHPTGTPNRRGRQPNSPSMHPLAPGQAPPSLPPNPPLSTATSSNPDDPPMPVLMPERKIGPPNTSDSNSNQSVGSNSNPGLLPERTKTPDSGSGSNSAPASSNVSINHDPATSGKNKAVANPYCDFCLGTARENKKTGSSEGLVSCSDCGRSGHPTCLQFTPNMIISVRKYRWQCIECKCCSICGTSDNDDQLLFCDDCDRGYHMYCLKPPLAAPPIGSWSCRLCLIEFHSK